VLNKLNDMIWTVCNISSCSTTANRKPRVKLS